MTQGLCERCGGTVDQAGDCAACAGAVTPVPGAAAAQPVITTSAGLVAATTAQSSESDRSEACRRFGWDPSTPDEMPSPAAPQPDVHKTVTEAALPAPELEALFAALESSPIRIKHAAPEPVAEPVGADTPAADAIAPAVETPFDVAPAPQEPALETFTWTGNAAPIALKPIVPAVPEADVPAPFAFDAPQSFDEAPVPPSAPLDAPQPAPTIHEPEHVSAAYSLQAAITAASEPIALKPLEPLEPLKPVDLSDLIDDLPAIAAPPPASVAAPEVIVAEAPVAPSVVAAVVAAPPVAAAAPEPFVPPPVATMPVAAAPAVANAPAKPPIRWRPLVTAGATVLILAAIGVPLSRLWLERAGAQPAVQQAAPKPAPASHAPSRPPASAPATTPTPAPAPVAAPVAASPVGASAPVLPSPARTAAAVPSRPASTEQPRSTPVLSPDALVAPRPARPAAPPVVAPQPAPSLTALAPAVAAPNVSTLPAPTAEAAPEPPPAAPDAPAPAAGPFFELNDVDIAPKVTSRVPAVLPESLDAQTVNEIVVVRVLVSQTGRPALVSLLRHSKAGLALDEAVIAAVKQWTFTPAKKHGRTVSCFYHVAFPVSQR